MVEQNSKLKDNKKKGFSLSYIVVFVIAIISLSKFFNSYHYFETGNDLVGYIAAFASLAIFLLCMLFMSFRIYTEEKAKNNLKQRFFFFDWLELRLEIINDFFAKEKKKENILGGR